MTPVAMSVTFTRRRPAGPVLRTRHRRNVVPEGCRVFSAQVSVGPPETAVVLVEDVVLVVGGSVVVVVVDVVLVDVLLDDVDVVVAVGSVQFRTKSPVWSSLKLATLM